MRQRPPGGRRPGHTKVKLARTFPEPARTRALQESCGIRTGAPASSRAPGSFSFMGVAGGNQAGSACSAPAGKRLPAPRGASGPASPLAGVSLSPRDSHVTRVSLCDAARLVRAQDPRRREPVRATPTYDRPVPRPGGADASQMKTTGASSGSDPVTFREYCGRPSARSTLGRARPVWAGTATCPASLCLHRSNRGNCRSSQNSEVRSQND